MTSPSQKDVKVTAGAMSQDFTYDTAAQGNSLTDMKWAHETYTFTATGSSTTLTFASQTAGAFGPVVDNISIKSYSQQEVENPPTTVSQ